MDRLKKLDTKVLAGLSVVLALVLLVAVNVLSSTTLTGARLDLTENKLYTLSDGTREVLKSIDEPITMRLYVSRALTDLSPAHAKYAEQVREVIENYVALSGGMIKLQRINPEPYSEAEDSALGFGLQGIPLTKAGDQGYFGLAATNSTDDQGVIAFFNPQREPHLEYDLTKLIYDLANPKKKVVGLMTSLLMVNDPSMNQRPWTVVEQMREFFDVRPLFGDLDKIDDDIDVLMIVQPKAISEKTKYAIDQYLLRGGKAMVFVDPASEAAALTASMMRQPPGDSSSDFEPFFKTWGIEYDPNKFVADRKAAVRVASEHQGRQVTSDYLAWLEYGAENLDRTNVMTSELGRITLAGAGSFALAEGSDLDFEKLIFSSLATGMMDAEKIRMAPDPVGLLQDFSPSGQSKVLAALIRGKVKSAFPDGAPKADKDKEKEAGKADAASEKTDTPEHLTESVAPMNVILIGDTDMLTDRFWIQEQQFFGQRVAIPSANNADLVINGLEVLTGSNSLIGLRSRGLSVRPFDRVEEIRKDAETRYRRTEQDLLKKMHDTEEKLGQIQASDSEGGAILTDDQKQTIETFRSELISIRGQLREVQHALRKDIESLDVWMKIVNIWAMPLLISILAIAITIARRVRRRRRHAAG